MAKNKNEKLQLKNNCKELKNNYYWLCKPKIKKRLVSEFTSVKRITWESTDLNEKFNLYLNEAKATVL